MAKTQQVHLMSRALKNRIVSLVREITPAGIEAAQAIAGLAEPPLCEVKLSAVLERLLAGNGFAVSRPWKNLPTAFLATAGRGKPVVALLAEYDALPDCGDQPGQWGHGCGHNLLGSGAVMAGIAAAKLLKEQRKSGTILVIGTPAEETLGGKVYLAAQDAFRGIDAVLAWHPNVETKADIAGGAAMDSLLFQFRGQTAHAAAVPHEGRSALDAAMLMDVAVNYLREHIPDNCRMHCVITRGGKAPNVVPDFAELWYYLRGRDRQQVDDLRRRVCNCAKGAALATETAWKMVVNTCNTERIGNRPLTEMLDSLLHVYGPPAFSTDDARQAGKVAPKLAYSPTLDPIMTTPSRASSDEDNVSWFAPLSKLNVACVPKGTHLHHRQWAQMARTSGAHKGLVRAAEVLAAGAVELCLNAKLLGDAKADYQQNMKGKKYDLPLPKKAPPAGFKTA